MATPSLSVSDELLAEVDQRCDLNRSRYIRDAILVRMMLEDKGEWYESLGRAESADIIGDDVEREAPADD